MLKKIIKEYSNLHPAKTLILGYFIYAILGTFALVLPICQKQHLSLLDNFFTAMSSVSTTGFLTVDIGASYTLLGQVIILLLIQAGAIGYMTFCSFVILATTDKIATYRKKVVMTMFPLPKDFSFHEFIRNIIVFTAICELIGAIILSILFYNRGIENPVWHGIFHSISSFCTAGFSLFSNNSIIEFQYDFWIIMVMSIQCILGGVGFIVFLDLYKKLFKKKERLTFTTKIIVLVTAIFLIVGTLVFFLLEDGGGTVYQRMITAFFQVVSASTTAGFNSVDLGALKQTTIIVIIFLMVFGASPAGTGGGVKSTTFAALVGVIKNTLKGLDFVTLWKRAIPPKRVQLATATFTYYVFVATVAVFFLVMTEQRPILDLVFEACSALGTVGMTIMATPSLSDAGKWIIIVLMFMGRVGILTFGFAIMSGQNEEEKYKSGDELIF